MTYAEAMRRYGSDKPDLRFGQELVECTDYFADTPFRVFQAEYVGAVVMPGGASQPRKQLDAWQEWAKQRGARGLAYVLVQEDGTLTGPVAKNLSETELEGLAAHVGAQPGDCVFFAAGSTRSSRALLGAARLEIGKRCGLIDENAWEFLWVLDAPLFEPASEAVAAGDVAVGLGRVDGRPPRLHLAEGRVPRHLRHRPRAGARLRVRHGAQRQRAGRRVDPYPPPRRAGARLPGHGPVA
jgi:aspartyl-tRNA synthetase